MKLLVKYVRNQYYLIKQPTRSLGNNWFSFVISAVMKAATFMSPKSGSSVLNLFAFGMTTSVAWLFSLAYYWNWTQHLLLNQLLLSVHSFMCSVNRCWVSTICQALFGCPFSIINTNILPVSKFWHIRDIIDPVVFRGVHILLILSFTHLLREYFLDIVCMSGAWDSVTGKTDKNPSSHKVYILARGEHLGHIPGKKL